MVLQNIIQQYTANDDKSYLNRDYYNTIYKLTCQQNSIEIPRLVYRRTGMPINHRLNQTWSIGISKFNLYSVCNKKIPLPINY